MARLVLATGNDDKISELERILAGLAVELVPLAVLGIDQADETGLTFEENALIKARKAMERSGLPSLADDSGLEVDALDGAPGVHSSRYAGPDADDDANNERLLRELDGVAEEQRTARFVCVAALVTPDGGQVTVRGTMEGRIAEAPRGSHGFGYDPLFVTEGHTRTNGQLTASEKDALSHRGEAFRAIRPHVERMVAT